MPHKGHRGWGHIRKLPSGNFQASYIGPDLRRHKAPQTYAVKTNAEGWLAQERQKIEVKAWRPPAEVIAEGKATLIPLSQYGKTWIANRPKLKPRTRSLYESQWRNHIEPTLGPVPVAHLSADHVRRWWAGLGTEHDRRNAQLYGLLHAVCGSAVREGLLAKQPCVIEGATMNTTRKREPVILPVGAVGKLADAIRPERYAALVLLAAWCGLRWGEVTELRRKDISGGCEIVTVARAVTRRDAVTRIDTPKSGRVRNVVVPPHIREAVKHHLDVYVDKDGEALLFPNSRGDHLNDRVFSDSFRKALKDIGQSGVRVHDLRHFAGTMAARVGNLPETMARLGHSTVKASLIYQGLVSGRDAEIAAALSELASRRDSTI